MRLHLRTMCVISLCLWMGLGWVRAADAVQHVRIVGGSYFFKPNHVVVKVGHLKHSGFPNDTLEK